MKRSTSAPCLTEDEQDYGRKRIKPCLNERDEPDTREYLQLALARVLEMQRAVNEDTCYMEETSDLGELNSDEDIMKHVLTKIFRDLPGTSKSKVSEMLERGTRLNNELARIRGKSIQLSGYDTCRKIAVDFMRKSVKEEKKAYQLPESPAKTRRRSIGNASFGHELDRNISNGNSSYELRTRMLTSLDLHLANKQRDYTARLMRC